MLKDNTEFYAEIRDAIVNKIKTVEHEPASEV
jgi:hypothetical protein